MATLKLKTLTCYETDDDIGTDEPYLKVNGETVWGPASVGGAGDTAVDAEVTFGDEATVELWEKDRYSADDLLGTCTVHAEDAGGGELEARFTYDKAHYKLTYEVV